MFLGGPKPGVAHQPRPKIWPHFWYWSMGRVDASYSLARSNEHNGYVKTRTRLITKERWGFFVKLSDGYRLLLAFTILVYPCQRI